MRFVSLFCLFCFPIFCGAEALPKPEPSKIKLSEMEINHIRVATPHLFDSSKTLIIRLDSSELAYCFPLKGAKLISNYGSSSGRSAHTGCDLKTFAGDTIRAAFDGLVRMSKPYSGYGNVIVIRHPNGLETVYSHNSVNFCKSGDLVVAGEAIALTGRTGRASTEHLHFETRINGTHFSPHLIFDIENNELNKVKIKATLTKSGVTIKNIN